MWTNNKTYFYQNTQSKLLLFLLCSVIIVVSSIYSFVRPLGIYDEGFALTNAWRIMNGEIPHRDYWAAYPPGASFTLAGFFSFFDPSPLVARFVNLGWTLLFLGSFFTVLKQFASPWISLGVTAIASLLFAASFYPSYSVIPALALILFSLAVYIKAIKTESTALIVIGGTIAGLTVLFRHDFAGYYFFSVFVALFATSLIFSQVSRPEFGVNYSIKFLFVFLIVTILLLSFLLIYVGWNNFFQQAIIFPATGMRENRLLPFPGFLEFLGSWKARWFLAWAVPVYIAVGLFYFWFARLKPLFYEAFVIIGFATISLLLSIQAHNRLDMPHAAPSMLFTLCFLIVLTVQKPSKNTLINNIIRWGVVLSFCAYSLLVTFNRIELSSVFRCIKPTEITLCITSNIMQSEVVDYIDTHYMHSDYVFVGNTRHDKIFINDASLYFHLKMPIPIKWNEMHPGIITTHNVQEEIIKQLEAKLVKIIVLADMPEPREKNSSSISSNIHLLDDHIKNNYQPVFNNKTYSVLERISK